MKPNDEINNQAAREAATNFVFHVLNGACDAVLLGTLALGLVLVFGIPTV